MTGSYQDNAAHIKTFDDHNGDTGGTAAFCASDVMTKRHAPAVSDCL